MSFLLDTNTCIAYLTRRSVKVEEHIRRVSPADIALCSVVKSELLFGAHKSSKVAMNLARLEVFFRPFISFSFDDTAAESAARVRAHLEAAGTPIGPNDLLIASIALARGLVVVTHNTAEFGRVPGLRIEDWVA
jgi:tRNA(fMet)-specific endonuclease VapC